MATARPYLRQSKDKDGHERSVNEQDDDLGLDAQAHGWDRGIPYREPAAVSASRYSTKARAEFNDLLRDLKTGAFGAPGDILQLWESSRGSRRVGEWVELVDRLEEAGIKVWVSTHQRLYDPANPRDRRTLLEDAVDSEYETSKNSLRIRRDAAAHAAAGRPWGVPPFGYQRQYDPRTGRLINWIADPKEAPIIREMYTRLRSGHSLRGIASDFAARNITARSGIRISPQNLRSMAKKAAHTGRRVHHGQTVKGTWEPIIDDETWFAVQRILNSPTRKTGRDGRAAHELTMIIRCDVCSGPLSATFTAPNKRSPRRARYTCHTNHCVVIDKHELDDVLIGTPQLPGVLLAYLASPQVYDDLARDAGAGEQATAVRNELAAARLNLQEFEAARPESLTEARILSRSIETLTEKVNDLEARERALTAPASLLHLIKPGPDVHARWTAAPISARREVARLLLAPAYLGEVRIMRSPKRGVRTPAVQRIHWHRTSAPGAESTS